jgi:4-hydroxybenzoate polyprenyltransferase
MVLQTNQLLQLKYDHINYLGFVFCSTICSYNFHWYLTPFAVGETERAAWTRRHRKFHILLFILGFFGSAWFFFSFIHSWFWMLLPVALTFFYSAPKLPFSLFNLIKKVAYGKTLFLAFVWMYVSTLLPIILHKGPGTGAGSIFCISRFSFIYAICILFDYRDRENDKREGIRSLITFLDERGINNLFYCSILIFFLSTFALYFYHFNLATLLSLLIPGFIVLLLFGKAKRNFSDYLYYFVLDGMMMFSALFTFFLRF